MAHKHVITFRSQAKAEKVIESGTRTHLMACKKIPEYDPEGGLHPIFYIWYTQKEATR